MSLLLQIKIPYFFTDVNVQVVDSVAGVELPDIELLFLVEIVGLGQVSARNENVVKKGQSNLERVKHIILIIVDVLKSIIG